MKITFVIILFAMILLLAGCAQQQQRSGSAQNGRVVFTITDKAANIGSVTSIKVTVESVSVQSATKGWVTVSSTPKTYDLLQLKASGKQALLVDTQLDNGAYNQIRLKISKVIVSDARGEQTAKLPSGNIKMSGDFEIKANTTSAVKFDFIADESLHVTGNGKYILAPVVHLQTRENAMIRINNDNDVEVSGGILKTDNKVGMNERGDVDVGIKIPAEVNLDINDAELIIIGVTKTNITGKGRLVVGIKDKSANLSSVVGIRATIDSISAHSNTKGWITISTTPKTYDLLQLQGKLSLAADVQLDEGTYQQIKMQISKVVVVDSNGEQTAKLPSNELKVIARLELKENSTSAALFDFIANESLHTTNDAKYVMAPVLKVETRDGADVELKSNNEVAIRGGTIKTSSKVGMDENGNVDVGLGIPSEINITIDAGGKILRKSSSGNASARIRIGTGSSYD